VIHVNWYEAEAYCRWAKRRLPTEAEWEMAATLEPETGRKRRFPWGDISPTPEHANLDFRAGGPVDVRAFPAGDSPAGCRQMIGNIWEWVDDTFEAYPGFECDPYREYSQPYFGRKKVLRGGAGRPGAVSSGAPGATSTCATAATSTPDFAPSRSERTAPAVAPRSRRTSTCDLAVAATPPAPDLVRRQRRRWRGRDARAPRAW
jgi:formylglycine-generating enzyme required for sulfatase activity